MRAAAVLRLGLWSALVGSLVAVAAALLGVGDCGSTPGFAAECRSLVRTLSIRMGIFAAAGTAVMALFVAGLGRMGAQDDADRRERLREAFGDPAER